MPAYMISYDLRGSRSYEPLIKQLRAWGCVSPMESLWLGALKGNAATIRDVLMALIDADDGLLVCEVKPTSDWGSFRLKSNDTSVAWIKSNIGP